MLCSSFSEDVKGPVLHTLIGRREDRGALWLRAGCVRKWEVIFMGWSFLILNGKASIHNFSLKTFYFQISFFFFEYEILALLRTVYFWGTQVWLKLEFHQGCSWQEERIHLYHCLSYGFLSFWESSSWEKIWTFHMLCHGIFRLLVGVSESGLETALVKFSSCWPR